MEIFWYGLSTFVIETKNTQVVIDPSKKNKFKGDIVLVTDSKDKNINQKSVKKANPERDLQIVDKPGEYEISGIMIQGIPAFKTDETKKADLVVYTIRAEGMNLIHLGGIGQKKLLQRQLEEINGADIMLIPVGGEKMLSGKEAEDIVSEIEPKIVIPINYKTKGEKTELSDASEFLKAEGVKDLEAKPSLKIEKKKLPADEREVVILSPNSQDKSNQ